MVASQIAQIQLAETSLTFVSSLQWDVASYYYSNQNALFLLLFLGREKVNSKYKVRTGPSNKTLHFVLDFMMLDDGQRNSGYNRN